MGGEVILTTLAVLLLWGLLGLVAASVMKSIWAVPRWPVFCCAFIGAFVTLALASYNAGPVPPERQYSAPELCLEERRWVDVIAYATEFGAARGLTFHGGANAYEGAGLNIALLKEGGLFRSTEIALNVFSHPIERGKSYFWATTREKLTPADAELAKQFEAGLLKFSCERTSAFHPLRTLRVQVDGGARGGGASSVGNREVS
jgi:hypothetical protein